jgi:phenylacetate-CoA ligase
MIWNPEYETMDRTALHELQLRRLQMTTAWAYERVSHYRDRMDELGVRPRDIRSLEDVRRLPFTDKSALRDTYPFGMFALPMDEVVRIHSSSGTTGKPIVVGYSRGDVNTWTECTARVAAAAGVHRGDLVQMGFLYGMFTGGWGMHYGIERIGATVIPAGSGQTERHLLMMQDFGTTAFVGTPSYALYLAEQGDALGVDFSALKLRLGLFGGEPPANASARAACTSTRTTSSSRSSIRRPVRRSTTVSRANWSSRHSPRRRSRSCAIGPTTSRCWIPPAATAAARSCG